MAETDSDFSELEDLFRQARHRGVPLPGDLERRIVADGLRVQRARQSRAMTSERAPGGGLRRFFDLLGGWPALGGLATACAAGVWLGLAPPRALPDPLGLVQGADTGLFAGDDLVLALAEE